MLNEGFGGWESTAERHTDDLHLGWRSTAIIVLPGSASGNGLREASGPLRLRPQAALVSPLSGGVGPGVACGLATFARSLPTVPRRLGRHLSGILMAMDEARHLDMRRATDCEVAAGIPRPVECHVRSVPSVLRPSREAIRSGGPPTKVLTFRVGPVLWVSDARKPRPGNVVA